VAEGNDRTNQVCRVVLLVLVGLVGQVYHRRLCLPDLQVDQVGQPILVFHLCQVDLADLADLVDLAVQVDPEGLHSGFYQGHLEVLFRPALRVDPEVPVVPEDQDDQVGRLVQVVPDRLEVRANLSDPAVQLDQVDRVDIFGMVVLVEELAIRFHLYPVVQDFLDDPVLPVDRLYLEVLVVLEVLVDMNNNCPQYL